MELHIPFESEEASKINKTISATMYFAALEESCQLARERGRYSTFAGSPLSEGLFQFNLWEKYGKPRWQKMWNGPEPVGDWQKLREDIMKYGVRNSLLIALMPTKSSGRMLGRSGGASCGNNECFEPIISNYYTTKIASGTFPIINYRLIEKLRSIGLWNTDMINKFKANEGNITNIEEIPSDIKAVYKTVYEMSLPRLIEMSAERGPYVCQSESSNRWFLRVDDIPLANLYAWELGLKTCSYYTFHYKDSKAAKLTTNIIKVKQSDEKQPMFCDRTNKDCAVCQA
jgi:ribonucleoside-diphosphate reductase alpha chain